MVLLYASFLLIEQDAFAEKLTQFSTDPGNTARIRQITDDINTRVGSYLAVKTGVCALLNYIPYIGSFVGVALPVTMAVVQFGDLGVALAVLAILTAIQFVIGNFLDPYLMGSSLNLSPFAILMSLAMWSQLWGLAGRSWPSRSRPSSPSCSPSSRGRVRSPCCSRDEAGSDADGGRAGRRDRGIEPPRSASRHPSPVLKTGPGTSLGRPAVDRCIDTSLPGQAPVDPGEPLIGESFRNLLAVRRSKERIYWR